MENNIICQLFLNELETEAAASKKCLANLKDGLFEYKPHEKSMALGNLAVIVSEIPRWISTMIEEGDIDFAAYRQWAPQTAKDLVEHLDETMAGARKAFQTITDKDLKERVFRLKNGEQVFLAQPLGEAIGSTINHWVHHRGQLTVYMRLNDLPVPAIYGPSADDQSY